jgi:hypothetical protein
VDAFQRRPVGPRPRARTRTGGATARRGKGLSGTKPRQLIGGGAVAHADFVIGVVERFRTLDALFSTDRAIDRRQLDKSSPRENFSPRPVFSGSG